MHMHDMPKPKRDSKLGTVENHGKKVEKTRHTLKKS